MPLYDEVSLKCSELATRKYSTSFTLGISFLDKRLRGPIYAIYGFVRFADEIVDTFHDKDKASLLAKFSEDTYAAIRDGISLNPILHSFQWVVNKYSIRREWIDRFLESMEMDLDKKTYTEDKYKTYILGSAEVVGLMCLHVFSDGDEGRFEKLKPYAMKLGSAFQKINFLRDVKADREGLGRTYFPGVDMSRFTAAEKALIEADIEKDFADGLEGIRMLPRDSRKGVYLAYYYYLCLFKKIRRLPPHRILEERIRIPDIQKIILLVKSNLRHQLNLI